MPTAFAEMMQQNWPVMTDNHGQSVAYIPAGGVSASMTCVVTGKSEALSQNDTWETAARQIEVFAAVSDAPASVSLNRDVITVDSVEYIVLERQPYGNGLYRYLCERRDLTAIEHRGRMF